MALIAGIDPGAGGAIAVYDQATRQIISVQDIPSWFEAVGRKKRRRIDVIGLIELFEGLKMIDVELVVMEAVGGRPRQSASAGFVFGFSVGVIYAICMSSKIMVETVPPQRWKKVLGIPGKAGGKDSAAQKEAHGSIMKRVDEIFPQHRQLFRTDRGKFLMDRADACLIAKFGGDVVHDNRQTLTDLENKLAYRNADLGA